MKKQEFIDRLTKLYNKMSKEAYYAIIPHPIDRETVVLGSEDVLRWIRVIGGEEPNIRLIEFMTMDYANQIWKQLK